MTDLDTSQARANEYWDQKYGNDEVIESERDRNVAVNYTEHPYLYGIAVSEPLTGSTEKWWLGDVAAKYFDPPMKRVLALGSGLARPEEVLVQQGFFEHITCFEMSEAAGDAVRERIRDTSYQDRMVMRAQDVTTAGLKDESFDLVMVEAALHHIINIEEVFALMHRVLKPGGLLLFDEYVGPDHHMFPPDLMAQLNRINAILPDRLKWNHFTNELRVECPPPSLEWMMATDPTEGVHSTRILPLAYQYFDVLERKNFGGALLRPFFSCILPNFDFDDEGDRTIARMIVLLEQELTAAGALPHHNVIIVGRKRGVPLKPLSNEQVERIAYSDWVLPENLDVVPGSLPEKGPTRGFWRRFWRGSALKFYSFGKVEAN